MSCTCQYYVIGENVEDETKAVVPFNSAVNAEEPKDQTDDNKRDIICASPSDLVASKAEIWVLQKKLADSQISIENLELLVKTVIERQNLLVAEMFALKRQNLQSQEECRMQRDYQTMERNAMIRETYELKIALGDRTRLLKRTLEHNEDLKQKLKDANDKIYTMSLKYFKAVPSKLSLSHPSVKSSSSSSLSEQSEHSSHSERSERSGRSKRSDRSRKSSLSGSSLESDKSDSA